MNNTPEIFYTVGDKEYITTASIDEAIQEWYDDLCLGDDLQEEVEVSGWTREVIPERYWDNRLEDIVEGLDENYSCACGDYTPSDKAKELWEAFTTQVGSEYKVSQLKLVTSAVVKVGDYINVAS